MTPADLLPVRITTVVTAEGVADVRQFAALYPGPPLLDGFRRVSITLPQPDVSGAARVVYVDERTEPLPARRAA